MDAAIRLKKILPKQAIWQTITEPKEIERLLMERNKRHLQQVSIEEGPATKPPISTFLRNEGISADSEAVLNGTYTESIEVDPILAQWINNLKKPDAQQYFEQFSINGAISADELQAAFKAVNERTSSAGPIHYTLWKCMAAEASLAHWMAIMLSIPFLYGFAPSRWTDMVDVMLEKKKGNRKIHMLRIIGLLAPDFNTALKHFARKFAVNSESTNSLSEEQWGSRNNRQSIDAAMLKLLGFECARLKRSTVACTYFDQSACYDRMLPELSTILCQRMGMSKNLLRARSRVMHAMRRHVQTGIGISKDTYGNEPGDPVLCGEIQGKGDNPSLYNAQSSTMLNTHAQLAPGLRLNSCRGDGCIHRHNVSYVDDNDGNVSADHQLDFEAALQEVIEQLRESSQLWNTLVEYTGQSVSLHKCSWQFLAWKVVDGQMSIVEATDTTLLLVDHKGAPAIIQFLPPDQPNKGLGFLLCPDGNQRHQYQKVLEATTDIAMACSSTFLNPSEARQLLYQRLVPKVDYSLHLTSFSEQQCEDLNTVVRQHFLPKLGFNRNTPTAVVHGPMDQGGLDIIDFRSRQDELQAPDVIKHLRWGKTVANDLLVTLDNLQLVAGLTEPVLEDTEIGIRYVDRGFISCLQDRIGEIDGSLWIEDAWTPKVQRVDDESLMERFSMGLKTPRNATGKIKSVMSIETLKKLNAVRMYMRVITVADLADLSGTIVPYDKLTGDFRANSDLEWPNQPKPPPKWFQLFRKFFRQTFCWNMPPGSGGDFELDDPLGDWYDVPRHIRWPCYRSEDAIYYRGRNSDGHAVIQMFKKSKHNFFKYESDVESPPLNSHPAQAVLVDDSAWTTKPCRIEPTLKPEARPPGYITHRTHSSAPNLNPKETCSDGSINYIHQSAAAAWIIAEDKDNWIQAAFLMTDVSSLTSYRAELEGIFRSLYHMDYLGMEPTQTITQWCDNKAGVLKSNDLPETQKAMLAPEADLLLAIHKLRKEVSFLATSKHVYGHQDTKKRQPAEDDVSSSDDENQSVDPEKSSEPAPTQAGCRPKTYKNEALMNMQCDTVAGSITALDPSTTSFPDPTQILQPPYPGSRAMLRIGDKWITSKLPRHIHNARATPKLRAYILKRTGWTDSVYDSVHWPTIGSVRRHSTQAQQRFTCKLMHDWLPMGKKRAFVTGCGVCPGCPIEVETISHLFHCPNPTTRNCMDDIIAALRKKGLKDTKVARSIWKAIATAIEQFSRGETVQVPTDSTPLAQALSTQSKIGWNYFLRGYIASDWLSALQATRSDIEVQIQLQIVLKSIWFDITEPMWHHRNELAHGSNSAIVSAIDKRLTEQLQWYRRHQHQLLPADQQYLRRYEHARDLTRLGRSTKVAWLKHLRAAATAWRKRKNEGQKLITTYFQVTSSRTETSLDEPTNRRRRRDPLEGCQQITNFFQKINQ